MTDEQLLSAAHANHSDAHYAELIHDRFHHLGGDSIATNLVHAARHTGLTLSVACALVEHESNGKNVFGHDRTIFIGAGRVTRAKYLRYKLMRKRTGKMQGVGYTQLTWYGYQDLADKRGGCYKAFPNLVTGFEALAANIRAHGLHDGLRRYNGSGAAAERYARDVTALAHHWHDRLT